MGRRRKGIARKIACAQIGTQSIIRQSCQGCLDDIINFIYESNKTETLDKVDEGLAKKAKRVKEAASAAVLIAGKVGCPCEGCATVTNIDATRIDGETICFILKTNAQKLREVKAHKVGRGKLCTNKEGPRQQCLRSSTT